MDKIDHVLIVDDDRAIRELIADYLEKNGMRVSLAANGREMRNVLDDGAPDLIVLDLMMPGEDGLTLCRDLRAGKFRTVPVLMLTARGEETDRIIGLEMGADDYLAKPFSMLELVARVRALLRRTEALERNARIDAGSLRQHGVAIDPIARTASVDERRLELTPREFDLLHFFARNPDKVFSRLDLLNQVWGYQHEGYEHTVNTHINRLRTKIEADPSNPQRILTVWGRGYKFAAAPGAPAESAS